MTTPAGEIGSGRPSIVGLSETKLALMRLLFEGQSTMAALSSELHLHPTVLRRHLADLQGLGLVASHPQRGTRGRPRIAFGLTGAGREAFYARYDTLLSAVADAAVNQTGAPRTRAIFEEAGIALARKFNLHEPPDELLRVLREIGFQPELKKERGRRLMISRNCPVYQQARRTPELCCEAFHTALLNAALESVDSELTQTMARGAPYCVHVLRPR